jgi:hypothetical protein
MKSMPALQPGVIAAAVLFFSACGVGRAQTIADLPEARFKSVVEKTNLYVKALRATHGIQRSYDRYASWVDLKLGPTGKEHAIDNGVYDISSTLQDMADAGQKGPGLWPPLPNVDSMAQKLGEVATALAPLLKSASDYYAQHSYKNDGAKRGQELHAQMMPLFEQAFTSEMMLRRGLHAVKEDVDRRNLAQLEKEHGKNFEWHLRSFLMTAETVGDLLPNHLDAAMIDGGRFKQRCLNLDAAFAAFTQFSTAHPEEVKLATFLGNSVQDFLGASKFLRLILESPKPDKQVYLTKVSELSARYEDLLQRANSQR